MKALQRERQQLCLQERQQQQRSLHQQRSLVLQRRRQPPSGGPEPHGHGARPIAHVSFKQESGSSLHRNE